MNILRLDLPAEPASIAQARDALGALAPQVGEELLPDLRLLLSEVVTNAVRHSGAAPGARVQVVAENGTGCVRVEVHDEGCGFVAPAQPGPRPEGTSGWGLFLVQNRARRWGTQLAPDAHVWFELALGVKPG
ncbi:MAG: ATP-binding protein [Actinomycetota bacterium]|nr:ATP-binding protein [Actinomycetota bacterium]